MSKNSKSRNEPYNPGWNDEQIAIIRDVLSGKYLNLVSGGKEAITNGDPNFLKTFVYTDYNAKQSNPNATKQFFANEAAKESYLAKLKHVFDGAIEGDRKTLKEHEKNSSTAYENQKHEMIQMVQNMYQQLDGPAANIHGNVPAVSFRLGSPSNPLDNHLKFISHRFTELDELTRNHRDTFSPEIHDIARNIITVKYNECNTKLQTAIARQDQNAIFQFQNEKSMIEAEWSENQLRYDRKENPAEFIKIKNDEINTRAQWFADLNNKIEAVVNFDQTIQQYKSASIRRTDMLEKIKTELTNPDSARYAVIPRVSEKVTSNVPGYREAYEDFENRYKKYTTMEDFIKNDPLKPYPHQNPNRKKEELETVHVMVIDDFANSNDPLFKLFGGKKEFQNALPNPKLTSFLVNDELQPEKKKGKRKGYSDHGVHVAGIICDMAPNVKIIPAMMSEATYVTPDYSLNLQYIKNNPYKPKIINLSGGGNISAELVEILTKDHIIIKALGNDGLETNEKNDLSNTSGETVLWSSILKNEDIKKHIILVSNLMSDGVTLDPSSTIPGGNKLIQEATVAARGNQISSTTIQALSEEEFTKLNKEGVYENTLYKDYSGTSMAAPVVTGLVAQLIGRYPDLSLEEVVSVVKGSCKANDKERHLVGNGAIDYTKAYEMGMVLEKQKLKGVSTEVEVETGSKEKPAIAAAKEIGKNIASNQDKAVKSESLSKGKQSPRVSPSYRSQ